MNHGGKRQSGCVSDPRRVQEGPDFRIDALLLLFADYTSPVQGVGFYRASSRVSGLAAESRPVAFLFCGQSPHHLYLIGDARLIEASFQYMP